MTPSLASRLLLAIPGPWTNRRISGPCHAMNKVCVAMLATILATACGHSDPFAAESPTVTTPFSTVVPTRLTYNPADNYWPSWTEDGKGIIYSFSQTSPDVQADDRCLGLLPASGGTRIWEMCDLRREHADSADSFVGAAIGTDGRLVYLEISAKRGAGGTAGVNPPPQSQTLWLADTAFPFQRRKLGNLGQIIGDAFVNWIRDTHWIGPSTFVTLAQFQGLRHPMGFSSELDSTFVGLGVMRGEITATGAALSLINGTSDARAYSLAENGATVVFARNTSDTLLERVPVAGGSATVVAKIPSGIIDVSCSGTTCLVDSGIQLVRVTLATGESVALATRTDGFPRISPTSTDVVARNITGTLSIYPPLLRPLGSLVVYRGLLP